MISGMISSFTWRIGNWKGTRMTGIEDAGAGLFLTLLITIAFVAAVVHFIRIPYTVALVLAGLALAVLPGTPRVSVTPSVILFLFLPILLFYGSYHLMSVICGQT